MYTLDDYDYDLPERLIAQNPTAERDDSRLLHLNRSEGAISHRFFGDIVELLRPSDLLVINDTKVIPGRLYGRKSSGGKVELLILDYGERNHHEKSDEESVYQCLIKASKQARAGTKIYFPEGLEGEVQAFSDGIYSVEFSAPESIGALLDRIGRMPLPPYIKREEAQPDETDRTRYQTVYAREKGAIAAPTAGLHFTHDIFSALRSKGVTIATVTLHVGYGTFVPVRVEDIRDHQIHEEWFDISNETAKQVNQARSEGRRVVAVGTTSVRTLEYATGSDGSLVPGCGRCDLFIYPGYQFKQVDAMITNFHLPRSTLLMLVSAFVRRETMLNVYAKAVEEGYRFFSYGDAMLIE
jgi:S-adenosylmethionine:tRNA ribosyltransferase-isomerase